MKKNQSYGHCSDDGWEYIITKPDTPRPWINYLHNGDYCALCSHVGGGFSFYQDHRVNPVLRRGLMQHIEDLPGRFFYLHASAATDCRAAPGAGVDGIERGNISPHQNQIPTSHSLIPQRRRIHDQHIRPLTPHLP